MTEMLWRYLQIDYARNATQEHGVPWVVVAVAPTNPDGTVLVYRVEIESSQVEQSDREYLEALVSDWTEVLNRDGNALLDSLGNLAVGPIRAGRSALCTEEQLRAQIRALRSMAGPGRTERPAPGDPA